MDLNYLRGDVELRGFFEVFLDRAQLSRVDERVAVFLRESRRDLDLQINFFDHPGEAAVHPLDDADALGGQAALLAKTEHINPGACADG